MRKLLRRLPAAVPPLGLGVTAGLLAGAIWTAAQPSRFEAQAGLVLRVEGVPTDRVAPSVRALAQSSILAANVAQTLHLRTSPRLSARTSSGGLLTLSVKANSEERARQIDAEASVVLMRLVAARFKSPPKVEVSLLDPAHSTGRTSPTAGRNFLIGGSVGLALGLAAALALRGRSRTPLVRDDPGLRHVERRLDARIKAVTERERALARRAGELAVREQRLAALTPLLPVPPRAAATPAAARRPETVPESVAPTPVPAGFAEQGRWSLHELETLVASATGTSAGQHEEWTTYLFLLRQHADAGGMLPASFDALVADVFGALLR